jgi:hypothetical protein
LEPVAQRFLDLNHGKLFLAFPRRPYTAAHEVV